MCGHNARSARRNHHPQPKHGGQYYYAVKTKERVENGMVVDGKTGSPPSPNDLVSHGKERTVRKLKLSKTLTVPEGVTVTEACRRMAHRRVDAVMLTNDNGMLSGIVTDKDIATRVIAEELKPEQTIVSRIMTKNPVFVTLDTLAIDALQEMVNGKFRHLPVVENGEAVGLLDITKCLYDAITRMEKCAEQGSAIAAAVEGVERQWGNDFGAHYAFIETLRERMFKPSLSTVIMENTGVAVVQPSDSVYFATVKMRELHVSSAIVMVGGKLLGILSTRDVLMRVVARNLSPELVPVERVMTVNPECATVDTTILDALHIMHDGKFLHLPVLDHEGYIVACVDVLHITHAALSMVDENPGSVNNMASTMIQQFWDSALVLVKSDEDCDTHSEFSAQLALECAGTGKLTYPSLGVANSFVFKIKDQHGRLHKFNCGTKCLSELRAAVVGRLMPGNPLSSSRLLYIDEEGDKIMLECDNDLVCAVNHARSSGWKALRLYLDCSERKKKVVALPSDPKASQTSRWGPLQTGILAGTVLLTGITVVYCLKRTKL